MSQTLNVNKIKFLTHSIENIAQGLEATLLTPKEAVARLRYEIDQLRNELGVSNADEPNEKT